MNDKVCTCMCHRIELKGNVKHCLPCCDLCYEVYIDDNGNIDNKLYDIAVQKAKEFNENRDKINNA